MAEATVRPTPCPSCPYRVGVPSGIWDPTEYDKLPGYDGDLPEQNPRPFDCHQGDGTLCAGWVGHRAQPGDLLAVRIGIAHGRICPDVIDYATDVALFPSGRAARDHGMADIEHPGPAARILIDKIVRRRGLPPRKRQP